MLILNLGGKEIYNSGTRMFTVEDDDYHTFNHSLYTIALWESKWRKPFLIDEEKTAEEMAEYIQIMCQDGPIDISRLTEDHIKQIGDFINEDQSATLVKSNDSSTSSSYVTSEVIYAQMCAAEIDWQAQHWHFSRLNKLIQVIADMRKDKKPMSRREILKQNADLNKRRREEAKTKG